MLSTRAIFYSVNVELKFKNVYAERNKDASAAEDHAETAVIEVDNNNP